MFHFVLRRLASAVPTLFIVVTLSFFLMRFAPGGPFNLERPLPPATMENLMKAYHLDQPLWNQYLQYLKNAVTGDFGPSYIYKDNTIAELIGKGLPYSITLGSYALLLALFGGVFIGTIAALRQNSFLDFLIMSIATVGVTVPNFVVGPVLTLVFAVLLSLLPAGGWGDGSWRFLILPMIALALPQLAVFARLTRGSMIEGLHTDHIRTARAYGLPPTSGRHHPRHAGCAASCRIVSGAMRRRAVDGFCRRRIDLHHSRRRSIFRPGRDQSRLHARHGNCRSRRDLRHRLQSSGRYSLRPS